jgi:hypothetical protein
MGIMILSGTRLVDFKPISFGNIFVPTIGYNVT